MLPPWAPYLGVHTQITNTPSPHGPWLETKLWHKQMTRVQEPMPTLQRLAACVLILKVLLLYAEPRMRVIALCHIL